MPTALDKTITQLQDVTLPLDRTEELPIFQDSVTCKITLEQIALEGASPTRTLFVDCNRTDSYTADGSREKPHATIQAAIDAVAALDEETYPVTISIATGYYVESVTIESLAIRRLYLVGEGNVTIVPSSGNALSSTSNNSNLKNLGVQNITFVRPVVLTGTPATESFLDVQFKDCNFVPGSVGNHGTLTGTCLNNLTLRNCYIEEDITLNNVNWSWIAAGQLQGELAINCSDTDIPLWGAACAVALTGVYGTGTLSTDITGTATLTLMPMNCGRFGSSVTTTIDVGVSVYAYCSILMGDWVVNGALYLRSSLVRGTISGTGTITLQTPDSQIANTSTVPGESVKDALDNLEGRVSALESA